MKRRLLLAIGGVAMSLAAAEMRDPAPMVHIPAGEFTMGTSVEEAGRLARDVDAHASLFKNETPRRKVMVQGFLIDKYPVTNRQYKRFVGDTGRRPPPGWNGPAFPEGTDDHPAANVFWQDADAYAKWAGKRLPTEEEWEKAARGTDGRQYPWGNAWDPEATRIDDPKRPQTRALTTPVGCFPRGASPYGVMDMCGNVAEWTSSPSQPSNPERGWAWYVVKGAGAAHCMKENFRCASVNFSAHTSRCHPWVGFRCALDCPQAPETVPPDTTPAREAPPVPACDPPDAEKLGEAPIRIIPGGGAGVRFEVPHLPAASFSLYMPEQSGAKGVPLSWGGGRPKVVWTCNDEGTEASYGITFPDRAVQSVKLVSEADSVSFTLAIRNLTDKLFTDVQSNTCFNNTGSAYFVDMERVRSYVWTDQGATCLLKMPIGGKGEPLHGGWTVARQGEEATPATGKVRHPFIFIVSRDGQWTLAQAYGAGRTVATNAHYSCLHSRPLWPDIPPSEERQVTGRLYFIKGGPDDLLARWKRDFSTE